MHSRTRSARSSSPIDQIAQLCQDLDFHDQDSQYASHNFHAFPAKFPPQLPRRFIDGLTMPGDWVLDPMAGSGTTLLEAYLAGRRAIGFDIDPLALKLARVKTTPLDREQALAQGRAILHQAKQALRQPPEALQARLQRRWDAQTRKFVNYWFAAETQLELQALIEAIEAVPDTAMRAFLQLMFSATIITRTGGVSLAFDLAHTRPHRAKVAYDWHGQLVLPGDGDSPRSQRLTKSLVSALVAFKRCLKRHTPRLPAFAPQRLPPLIQFGDARSLPLPASCVDLIVTSPPYAANAIDYMRAHKFSLVWLGYPVIALGQKRKEYIGNDAGPALARPQHGHTFLPPFTAGIVAQVGCRHEKKGQMLQDYFLAMTHALAEMFRVLKHDKAAIVVAGSSLIQGVDSQTHLCLAEIGRGVGFEVAQIGVRRMDRDRRMMPASHQDSNRSRIQRRMHQEYVIGFYKPPAR